MLVEKLQAAKVLYLTKVFPYPPEVAGDAVYSRGIIESLGEHCRLTVLCAASASDVKPPVGIDWRISDYARTGQAMSVFSGLPLISWRFATERYAALLAELLQERWDAIFIDNIGMMHSLAAVKVYRQSYPAVSVLYVSHEFEFGVRSEKYRSYKPGVLKRLAMRWDLYKVRRSEVDLVNAADIVTIIGSADLPALKSICADRKYLLLTPGYSGPRRESRVISKDTPRRILLVGGRRSEQKKMILLDWLAASYQRMLAIGVETVVVGDMDEGLKRQILQTYPNVRVAGFVENLGELIDSSRLGVIADTVGGGFKIRLMSHVFERLPIVGLASAISGLPVAEGDGYLTSNTISDLVDLVASVIDDLERLNQLQEAAYIGCYHEFAWHARASTLMRAVSEKSGQLLV